MTLVKLEQLENAPKPMLVTQVKNFTGTIADDPRAIELNPHHAWAYNVRSKSGFKPAITAE